MLIWLGVFLGFFWFSGILRQYCSLYRTVSQRGRKKKKVDDSTNVQTTPPAPTASAIGPCSTIIQISLSPVTEKVYPAPSHHPTTPYSILFHLITVEGRRGITDEFAAIPSHLVLFSAALVELAKSIPVNSLILSSQLFCLPFVISFHCAL